MSCRAVQPIVSGLEKEYAGRVQVVHVNILDPGSLPVMKAYGFSATPELYLVDANDKVIGFWDEVESKEQLQKAFDQALK